MIIKPEISIRYAAPDDAELIAARLREEDRAECAALGFVDPAAMMKSAIGAPASETLVVLRYDRPIAIFGIQPETLASSRALVWFLRTDELSGYPREILTVTRRYFVAKLMSYSVLYNYVDSRYRRSVKYLRLCGVRFMPERDRFFSGVRFHYFEVVR